MKWHSYNMIYIPGINRHDFEEYVSHYKILGFDDEK